MKVADLAPHFQIRLTRPGRMDEMEIVVEAMAHAASDDARAASARDLSHHIKSVIGISARIEVGLPGTAPRSEGKARRVVDDRPRD